MNMTTEELLKEYKMELNLREKLQYNDYEGIGRAFMLRGILLDTKDLAKKQYDKILKYEKIIEDLYSELIAEYPQLKEIIEEGRSKMISYQLRLVA